MAQLAELGEFLAQLLTPADVAGRTTLLVLQGTPFCNLDCDYCYLEHRDDQRRMEIATIAAAVRWVYEERLADEQLTAVWHAGEPLAVPFKWFAEALTAARAAAPASACLRFAIQTNAVLVDDAWCALFEKYQVQVGVSLDGPAWLHDRHRRDRRGSGTHAAVMRGIATLRRNNIPFHVICVLTADSLGAAEAIRDFFEAEGIVDIGFNIDEQEAGRQQSSLHHQSYSLVRAFHEHLFKRCRFNGTLHVREFDQIIRSLIDPAFGYRLLNDENEPFRIVTILRDGGISTFSPEMAGQLHPIHGRLTFGNVTDSSLGDVLRCPRFQAVVAEIRAGVQRCASDCRYFRLCRGGAPSNKLAEHGSFAVSETLHCRLSHQAPTDAALQRLHRLLA